METFSEHFGGYRNFAIDDIVEDILGRMKNEIEDYVDIDDIIDALNDTLIYDDDMWKVYQFFNLSPIDARWDDTMNEFINDLCVFCEMKKEVKKNERR